MSILIRVMTSRNNFLTQIEALRHWRTYDLKEIIEGHLTVKTFEQRLFKDLSQDVEMQDRESLDIHFPEEKKEVEIVMVRRAGEQAYWLKTVKEAGGLLQQAPAYLRQDKDVVLAAVTQTWRAMNFCHESMLADPDVALVGLEQDERAADLISPSLWHDRDFMLQAVRIDWALLERAGDELIEDRDIALAVVEGSWAGLDLLHPKFYEDVEVLRIAGHTGGWEVLKFVNRTGPAWQAICDDKEFVISAIKLDWRGLEHASLRLRADEDVATLAVQQDWRAQRFLKGEVKGAREVSLAAVQQDWCALTLAVEEMPLERDIALALVKKNWQSFRHLAERLRNDREIAEAAVGQCWEAIADSPLLCADFDMGMMAIDQDYMAFKILDPLLKDNDRIVKHVINKPEAASLIKFASDRIRDDSEIVLLAVKKDWRTLESGSEKVKANPKVVMASFEQDAQALQWASSKLLRDPKAMRKFVVVNTAALDYMDNSVIELGEFAGVLSRDKLVPAKVILAIAEKTWRALEVLSDEWRANKNIMMAAVSQSVEALEYIPDGSWLYGDIDVMRIAVAKDYKNMARAANKLWEERDIVLSAIEQNWEIMKEVPGIYEKDLWNDDLVVRTCVKQSAEALLKAAKSYWSEVDIALLAVQKDWTILKHAPKMAAGTLWSDKTIVRCAVRQSGLALQYAHNDLWQDDHLVELAISNNWEVMKVAPPKVAPGLWRTRRLVKLAVEQNWEALEFADSQYQQDLEIARLALAQSRDALRIIPASVAEKLLAELAGEEPEEGPAVEAAPSRTDSGWNLKPVEAAPAEAGTGEGWNLQPV